MSVLVSGDHDLNSEANRGSERVNVRIVGEAEVDDQLISLISRNELGHHRLSSSNLYATSVAQRPQAEAPEVAGEANGNRPLDLGRRHVVRGRVADQRPNDEPCAKEQHGVSGYMSAGQGDPKRRGDSANRQRGRS